MPRALFEKTGSSPELMRWAFSMIRLSFSCLKISESETVEKRSEAIRSAKMLPQPTEGS
jgi:hypothetical protein